MVGMGSGAPARASGGPAGGVTLESLLVAVGVGVDGEDLGVVAEAVDEGDDAGRAGELTGVITRRLREEIRRHAK